MPSDLAQETSAILEAAHTVLPRVIEKLMTEIAMAVFDVNDQIRDRSPCVQRE
jgi:hypothetical protein